MSLHYYLIENKLTKTPNDYTARIQDVHKLSYKEILKRMTSRGLTLTDTEVSSVFNEFVHVLCDALQDGYSITTPFLKIYPSIVGVFENEEDRFDSMRHSVRLNATMGNSIKVDQSKFITNKVRGKQASPEIIKVIDYQSQKVNNILTRKGAVEVQGAHIKIDEEDPKQGVFLENDMKSIKVKTYMHNKPSHLIFQMPNNIDKGIVRIVIKNQKANGSAFKIYTFEKPMTIV